MLTPPGFHLEGGGQQGKHCSPLEFPPLEIVLLKFIIDVEYLTKCMSNESMHM